MYLERETCHISQLLTVTLVRLFDTSRLTPYTREQLTSSDVIASRRKILVYPEKPPSDKF